jgi:hypothetical protein
MWSAPCPLLGNGSLNTSQRQRIFPFMQPAVDTKIKEDVFSMCPPRDYISGTEPNQGVVE